MEERTGASKKKKKNTKEVEVVEVLIESVRTTRFLWEF